MKRRKTVAVIIALALIAAVFLCAFLLTDLLACIAVSLIFAFILFPIVEKAAQRMKRTTAILILYVIIAVLVVFAVLLIVPSAYEQLFQLRDTLPQLEKTFFEITDGIKDFFDGLGIKIDFDGIGQSVADEAGKMLERALSGVVTGMGKLVYVAAVPVLTFYLLRDGRQLYCGAERFMPEANRNKYRNLLRQLYMELWRYFTGQTLLALMVALITWGALALIGVRFPLILGVIAGLTEFIPGFGVYIGCIPIMAVSLLDGKFVAALIAVFIIQQAEGSLLYPSVIGKNSNLHPAWVLLSVLTGSTLFGVGGMMCAVPTVLIVKKVVLCFYEDAVRKKTD